MRSGRAKAPPSPVLLSSPPCSTPRAAPEAAHLPPPPAPEALRPLPAGVATADAPHREGEGEGSVWQRGGTLEYFCKFWVCIHQVAPQGDVDVYFSDAPMDDSQRPRTLAWVGRVHAGFMFNSPDTRGRWHNYALRIVEGSLGCDHIDTMFPNQVCVCVCHGLMGCVMGCVMMRPGLAN